VHQIQATPTVWKGIFVALTIGTARPFAGPPLETAANQSSPANPYAPDAIGACNSPRVWGSCDSGQVRQWAHGPGGVDGDKAAVGGLGDEPCGGL